MIVLLSVVQIYTTNSCWFRHHERTYMPTLPTNGRVPNRVMWRASVVEWIRLWVLNSFAPLLCLADVWSKHRLGICSGNNHICPEVVGESRFSPAIKWAWSGMKLTVINIEALINDRNLNWLAAGSRSSKIVRFLRKNLNNLDRLDHLWVFNIEFRLQNKKVILYIIRALFK